jgi:2-haloacid dehalogenase
MEELLEAYGDAEARIETEAPTTLYPDVLRAGLRALGERFDAAPTDDELEVFGESVRDWPAFPDSADALATLAQRAQLIVVSNVDSGSFAFSSAKLGDPFTHRILASEVGAYKPADNHFAALFAYLDSQGIARGDLVHVAQSLFHDHVPAARHGLRSVWIDRRHGKQGHGATLPPEVDVHPMATFRSMAAFAQAFTT